MLLTVVHCSVQVAACVSGAPSATPASPLSTNARADGIIKAGLRRPAQGRVADLLDDPDCPALRQPGQPLRQAAGAVSIGEPGTQLVAVAKRTPVAVVRGRQPLAGDLGLSEAGRPSGDTFWVGSGWLGPQCIRRRFPIRGPRRVVVVGAIGVAGGRLAARVDGV